MKLQDVRDVLMSKGYAKDCLRSKGNAESISGFDCWVDCKKIGRDIRFTWCKANSSEKETTNMGHFEVLNKQGSRPMLSDPDEIFRLNKMQDFESLDLYGTKSPNLHLAIKMSRLESGDE